MILSALGALTIFGPWVTIDYYDHYGPIYESYNGFTLFDSGYFFGIAMIVPILISLLFVYSFIRFKVYKDQKCTNYAVIVFVAIFLLSWWFNVAVTDTYDNYPYYTEVYGSGFAETGAVGLAFINMIVAYLADSIYRKTSNKMEQTSIISTEITSQDSINYCPKCGMDLTHQSVDDLSYCPKCGTYVGKDRN